MSLERTRAYDAAVRPEKKTASLSLIQPADFIPGSVKWPQTHHQNANEHYRTDHTQQLVPLRTAPPTANGFNRAYRYR
jgi:hypothetical protein